MSKLYETKWIDTEMKDETKVIIWTENERYEKVIIGKFDFYYNEGHYITLEGKEVEVKRVSTIMNYLFKQNENLSWKVSDFDQAKVNSKNIKKQQEKEYKEELKMKDEEKAQMMIDGINNKEEKYMGICKSCENKSDEELEKLVFNTFKNASKVTLKTVFDLIRNYDDVLVQVTEEVQDSMTAIDDTDNVNVVVNNDEPEVFYYKDKTFENYNHAFNYVVQAYGKVHLIISSKCSILNKEKLYYLDDEFKEKKRRMNIDDAKLYLSYLESIPNSLDREDIYYKLKNWYHL